jgi:hypothetical protein
MIMSVRILGNLEGSLVFLYLPRLRSFLLETWDCDYYQNRHFLRRI